MDIEEKKQHYALAEKLLSEQNFVVAIVAGTAAMVLAAGFYAVISVARGGVVYGFMAIGVGAVVGLVMQFLGRGITTKFSIAAAILAVIGCFLGNLFAAVLATARSQQVSPFEVLSEIRPDAMPAIMLANLGFIDVVLLIGAIVAAAYLARRPLSRKEGLALHLYENRRPGMISES